MLFNINGTIKYIKYIKNKILNILSNQKLRNSDIKKNIIILTSNYTINIANNFNNYFKTLNISSNIVNNNKITNEILDKIKQDNTYLFLLGINHIKNINNISLPKNKYIIYQIEQLNQTIYEYNKLSEKILYLMENCYSLFDYSNKNLEYYPDYLREKVKILTPLIKEEENDKEEEENNQEKIDILFIGTINNRRELILDKLHEYSIDNRLYYNIKIVSNTFGNELDKLIKNSKLVINLHYYDNALLEIFRIHELLVYDCKILSENPGTEEERELIEKYSKVVNFFPIINDDLSNIENIFNLIDKNLNNKIDIVERKKFIYEVNDKNKNILKCNLINFK